MENRVTPFLAGELAPQRVTFSLEHRGHTFMIRCTSDVTRSQLLQVFMSMLKDVNGCGVDIPSEERMRLSEKLGHLIGKYEKRSVEQE